MVQLVRGLRALLLASLLLIAIASSTGAAPAMAGGCRPAATSFNLRVAGTGCATGRAVTRAYQGNESAYECYDGSCTIESRGYRWRCRWRVLYRSGYSQSGPQGDETIRGRIHCYRLVDAARVRWDYSGAGA